MAKLYFYYSSMNAGKSTTLLQSAHNYRERGMRPLLYTSALYAEEGVGLITSRIGIAEEADLYAAGDDTPWYLGPSPWGAPVVPPEWLLPIALQTMVGTRVPLTGAKGPGIWARHQLAICRPLRYDTPYTFSQHVVGKGSTARTLFVEYEFEVTDADGQLVIGRHQGKFLKRAA